jgi:S-formylglutathione hydrolase FrmB
VDVPRFVTRTLRIPQSAGRWAIAGFSSGGTCAVDLALRHPDVYGRFVDLAGDLRPNLGSRWQTRSWLFGGSRIAMDAHDPVRLLHTSRYDGMIGWFTAGTDDPDKVAVARKLAAAAAQDGLKVHRFTSAGAHNWQFAGDAFARILPALGSAAGCDGYA